jgi:hypothetical protein
MASINGDGYSGLSNLPIFRPSATDYRPKWGFYRAINTSMFVGTNWMEDQSVSAGPFLPGDYDLNGTVNADDYVMWRKTLGQTGANLAADGSANNKVDQADFNIWRAHFGQTAAGSGSGASQRLFC